MKILNFKITAKTILLFLFFTSLTALTSAYIAQYVFDYQPCILCLYQRKPFFAIISLSLIALTFLKNDKSKRGAILLCALLLLVNVVIASYHVGVEKKIFRGPTTCSSDSNLNEIEDLESLKAAFLKTKAIRCDEPAFVIYGFSMAALNIIYCFGLFVVTIFYRKKRSFL